MIIPILQTASGESDGEGGTYCGLQTQTEVGGVLAAGLQLGVIAH